MTPPALAWAEQGTVVLLDVVDALSDAELDAPTALPGWSRRHLLAHVGFNAEALRRLASWARTGEPTPMYGSAQQRSDEIDRGARWAPDRLRAFVRDTAGALAADLAGLPAPAWEAEVVTAQGRTVPATEIPWMRTREVAVHAVDLGAGTTFADLPGEVCKALVADVAALRSRRADGPALQLTAAEGGTWPVAGTGEPTPVQAPVDELARWLTGRGAGTLRDAAGRPVPDLGPWI